MALGMPTGMITTKKLKGGEHHIIDGRQRKKSIRSTLNPYELAETLQTQFPLDKRNGATSVEWEERILEGISEWFSSFSEKEITNEVTEIWNNFYSTNQKNNPSTANKETIASMKEEFSSLGITLESKSKKKLIDEAVKGKIGEGSSLTNKQKKSISPLYKFATTCCWTTKHSPKAEIDRLLKEVGYEDLYNWTGSDYDTNKPFYWGLSPIQKKPECIARKFFGHPEMGLSNWIWEEHKKGGKRSANFKDYLLFLGGISDANIDPTKAESQFGVPLITYFSNLIENSYLVIDSMGEAELAWCSLEESTTVSESMKIFQLINDSGHKLSTFELLASWPTWIETVVKPNEKNSLEWNSIWKYVDKTYTEKGTDLKPPEMGLTKWDLVSIIADKEADGIEYRITWGE